MWGGVGLMGGRGRRAAGSRVSRTGEKCRLEGLRDEGEAGWAGEGVSWDEDRGDDLDLGTNQRGEG